MSKAKAIELRKQWDNDSNSAKRLENKKTPIADMIDGVLAEDDLLIISNTKKRIRHLSQVLESLHDIYLKNKDLYGDSFLAFVGDQVIRGWPWKDFPFASIQAYDLIKENNIKLYLTQKDRKLRKQLKCKKIQYEHWTPISFFRDVFHLSETPLDAETFYHLLIEYYRVVLVTEEENKLLDKNNRWWRPSDTYEKLGISILNREETWQQLSDEN
ncbi:hypothetical protein [Acinetobacter junii]|uniref:Uncharacterized protein n=1 Tax=Acinetobacter junii TaxID=40215 RepID=A0AAX1MJC1_ACIJU|nr:hypothetical protein [Acinetobacter junii]QUY37406.1 hypothetical protein H2677_04270 [Acinetobacter junii]